MRKLEFHWHKYKIRKDIYYNINKNTDFKYNIIINSKNLQNIIQKYY